jgi:hypothetical protein
VLLEKHDEARVMLLKEDCSGFDAQADEFKAVLDASSLEPYDMMLGAELLAEATGSWTSSGSNSSVSQEAVNEIINDDCLAIRFKDKITITPPKCGNSGTWYDPISNKTLIEWYDSETDSGIVLQEVESVSGSSTTSLEKFLYIPEVFTLDEYQYRVRNCNGFTVFYIQEELVDFKKASDYEDPYATVHEYWYQYKVLHANRSTMLVSDQVQTAFTSVNFYELKGAETGAAVATATKMGWFAPSDWTDCVPPDWTREWSVVFHENTTIATVPDADQGTASDIRIAVAATMMLMAYRDGYSATDGFQHTGEGYLYFKMAWNSAVILGVFTVLFLSAVAVWRFTLDHHLKEFFFGLENLLLPKRAADKRPHPIPTDWY